MEYSMDMEKKDPQTFAIIGAAMQVHSCLGHGFLESVYQEALGMEFAEMKIPFRKEVPLKLSYKGEELNQFFKADFICFETVVVETKALSNIGNTERAQVINYLKATGLQRGLLLNFGAQKLQYQRLVFSNNHLRSSA